MTYDLLNQKAPPPGAGARVLSLDGLRGIAILCVVLHHFGFHPPVWVDWGPIAPNIFFLLSGYLITRSLFRLRNAGPPTTAAFWNQLGAFHVRRLARILPALYIMFAVGCLWGLDEFREGMGWHLTFLTNFRLVITDDWAGSLSHLWSLAVQEQFYLLWPVILLFPARWMPAILLAAFFGAFAFRAWAFFVDATPFFRWFMLPSSLDPFAAGGLIAWAERKRGSSFFIPSAWHYPVGAIALVCWICARTLRITVWPQMHPILALVDTLETLCIAWIFLVLISRPTGRMAQTFSHPVFIGLGRVSYGIFIWHTFVHMGLTPVLDAAGLGKEHPWAHYGILLMASVAVATLSWVLLERPVIQWVQKTDFAKVFASWGTRLQAAVVRRFAQPS